MEKSIVDNKITDEEENGGNGIILILLMLFMGMMIFLVRQVNCLIKEQADYQMMSFMMLSGGH